MQLILFSFVGVTLQKMAVFIIRWARTIKIDHATQADEDRMKPELRHKMYLLGHSDLATTERYMGSFDTTKTDNSLRSLFKKKKVGTWIDR